MQYSILPSKVQFSLDNKSLFSDDYLKMQILRQQQAYIPENEDIAGLRLWGSALGYDFSY